MNFDVDGKRVFATTGGKPFDNSRKTIIFLAGSALDHTFWGLHSRFFAFRNYSVLCPDTPGHGHSEGPALTSIEALADWLDAVVGELGIEDLSIVAHSQGCLVGIEYASRYPEKLRSLSLICSGLATPVNDFLLKAAAKNPRTAVDMMISWGFGPAGHFHQGPIPGNSMAEVGYKTMWRNADGVLATDLNACNNYDNGVKAAAAVRCPAQVLIAGKDRMAPAKATAKLAETLPEPEVTRIPASGHMLPLEAPDECRALLREFIFTHNPAC